MKKFVVFFWLFGGFSLAALSAPQGSRPNIVLIMADDMGFSDIGCFGSEIHTPNIDQLAAGGVRFTQFYNLARCWPTRASLLSGLYSHQTGIEYTSDLSERAVTVAEVLRASGYRTAMSGKWHLTPINASKHNWPLQRGFEHYFGLLKGAASYYDRTVLIQDNSPLSLSPAPPELSSSVSAIGYRPSAIEAPTTSALLTDAISEHAANVITEFGRQSSPFFLYVAYTAPHWPLHALPEDIARYKDVYLKGWDAVREARHQRQLESGIVEARWRRPRREKNVPAWVDVPDKEWQAHCMAVYAAQIDRLDQGIGKIIARLREVGADKNTLVLFLSDNGACAEDLGPKMGNPPEKTPDGRPVRSGNSPSILPGAADTFASYGAGWAQVSNTPFRLYKHWVHEGGIATPLIAWWPAAIQAGAITAQPGHVMDIMATCLDLAGAEYPETFQGREIIPLEGKSLLPILQGGVRPGHDEIFWEHEGNRAVRQGKWKLVFAHQRPGRQNSMHSNLSVGEPSAGTWELYNMENDRTEMSNLAGQHADLVQELTAKYNTWAGRVGVRQ